jgi:hypothetical protein
MDGLGICGRSPQIPKPKKSKMAIFRGSFNSEIYKSESVAESDF